MGCDPQVPVQIFDQTLECASCIDKGMEVPAIESYQPVLGDQPDLPV
jgi:hypothetical protein